ncbi:hypothetical protein HNV11_02250 [Spirosoma taeanense]|uniref:Lipoprotein n=1 Tax=Spirosoma taeanense TaxID=2735870 RepID=A0A6M5Y4I0_9BACT|nr:hypothetical protein [Spirosoma taeanense]QJW88280.1 hypothetical protein HNV11_02250 [Spirosoma taeanense]
MRRQLIQPYLFVFGIALTLSACFNEPNYSDTPEIEFKEVSPPYTIEAGTGIGKQKRDSVIITIGFKDGDGNLGNDVPVPKADSARYVSNGNWGNYKIRTFRLVNKKYEEVNLQENRILYFPDLTKGKPKGAIEGTLEFRQIYYYGNRFRRYPVKYQIQIRDRALNQSNVIETDTVTVAFPEN